MSIDSTMGPPLINEEVDRLVGALGEQWAPDGRKWAARAPGRLDVMGGFADYTGSLVLAYPVAGGVLVAVAPRQDQTVVICTVHPQGNGLAMQGSWPLAQFYRPNGTLAGPAEFAAAIGDVDGDNASTRDVGAALYALLEKSAAPHLGGGLTIGLHSELAGTVGVAGRSATSAATVLAVGRALELNLDPPAAADLAWRGQNLLWSRAQGIGDAAAVALAESGRLFQMRCQNRELLSPLPLPEAIALTGVDCGARHPLAQQKYIDTRVATFMGREIVNRIVAVEPNIRPGWQGYLCQLTLSDYVERLRDRLPTKIKGRDFLDRFDDTGDGMTAVDPDKTYKVRSRTEHHIYENTRAHQFAERLSRAARSPDQNAVTEAGELMYASHWSYGQRCGLGGIETDRLVNLLRAEGPAAGILGAKVSARGAGGTVVVLHTDTDQAREAIRQATDQYARLTNLNPRIFTGTSPGAGAWGVHEVG
ncbi:MAG: hypothetical protein GY778_30790 [bacterium]|nr:hypothetical protein [bacterium]